MSRLRRYLTGPAGPGPAAALAVIALLSAFVACGGPREVTVLQNKALRQVIAAAGTFGVLVQTDWQVASSAAPDQINAGQLGQVSQTIADQVRPPLDAPAARQWSGLATPFEQVGNPAPQGVLAGPPELEVEYRTGLARNARLASGTLPQAVSYTGQGAKRAAVLEAAVTQATAARLGLRIGSEARLVSATLPPGYLPVVLRVTGILRPTDRGASFWTVDPSLAAPVLSTGSQPVWLGAALVGPAELSAVEVASVGSSDQLTWSFPLDTRNLTAAQVPGWEQAMTAAQTDISGAIYGSGALPPGANASPAVSVYGAGTLSDFETQQAAVGTTDSLLVVGLAAVALILLLICAVVVAGAYAGELALIRARGGGTAQVAGRVAARTAAVAVPALAAGTLLAVVVTPGGTTAASSVLLAAVAVTTLAGPALLAAWRHRALRSLTRDSRDDVAIPRRSARRTVAEIAAGVAVAGAVVALRQRGLAPGAGVDPYTSAVPVLVALAAGLIAARLYPAPLRLALRLTSRGRSAPGYLALARAARARAGSLLPALALVVALAVIALGGMVRTAVSQGQVTASWQQVGTDAVVSAGGAHPVIAARQQAAIASVPGVRYAAAAYVLPAGSPLSANLLVGTEGAISVGVVIANPASYSAVLAGTPWPEFAAGTLARPGPGSTVPVIASPRVAAAIRGGADQLAFASSQTNLRLAGTVTGTAALPGSGAFIVMPSWVSPLLQASTAPNTMLLSGASINLRDLRAAARALPGSQVTSRAAQLQAAANAPSVQGSDLLFVLAAFGAAACGAAAVLLGLLLSGRQATQFSAWLTAMGMTSRQVRRLAVLDALPLLLTALVGGELAGLVIGPLISPALDLSAFTGSSAPVTVRPDAAALIAPAVGAIILVAVATAGHSALTRATAKIAILRLDEGR
jgi:putative ABC transport system permease protein